MFLGFAIHQRGLQFVQLLEQALLFGFAYLPSKAPHALINLTYEPGEIIVVYIPGGGHRFYKEFGPISRSGPPDPKVLAPLFAKYYMALLGPPLSPD